MREKIPKLRKYPRSAADLPSHKNSDVNDSESIKSDLRQFMKKVPALDLRTATDDIFRKACKVDEALENLDASPTAAPQIALARAVLVTAKNTNAESAARATALTQAILHANTAIAQAEADPNEATRLDADRKTALEQMLREAA